MRELHLTPSPPSSLAQRPTPSSLFYLSHSFPSYRGANTPPPTSVVPITGASPHPWKIPISTRSSIPSSRCPIRPLKQTNSYCSVEEIKEGKRQRLSCSSSNESNGRKKGNIYIEKGRNYKGGNEEEEEEEEEEGDNYYEKAPTSRPSSAMNLVKVKKQNMPKCQKQQQQKIPPPAPPALPPPNLSLLSYVRKNEEIPNRNGWQRRPSTTITTTTTNTPNRKEEINNENEWKENIKFKQRSNRTKFLVHILLFALCCSLLLMALPLLLLWFTNPNILQQQQPSTITTTSPPQTNKQQKHLKKEENKLNLENNLTKNLFSFLNFNRDLSIEPAILAKLILEEEGNNPSKLRIFEVRSEQTINKDGGQKQGER
ncbi:unnamed protein product [Meloidogyne enterolobii]|uniref:Uncharacterized protein n=1 Tax=Meloidogyne enterolobii TaxID=390850 RepID=A0ACB0XZ35_MELEN